MTETVIKIKAIFRTVASATRAMSKFKTAAKRGENDLFLALCFLGPELSTSVVDSFDIESLSRRKRNVYLDVLTGSSPEPPTWIGPPLAALGAQLVSVTETFDEGRRSTFFAGKKAKKVSRAQYEKWRQEALGLSKKRSRAGGLYLPKGRVQVVATVKDITARASRHWCYGYIKMLTDDGKTIYYEGENERLITCARIKRDKKLRFTARFNKGSHGGRPAPFTQDPQDIEVIFL